MQKLLDICSRYAFDHSLTYNAKNLLSLCSIPGTLKFSKLALYMDNLLILNVSECKYLGKIICQKNCDLDIKRHMRKYHANANVLLRRFSKCSTFVKSYLFETYCYNLYCASLCYNFTFTALKKLKIANSTALDD